MDIWRAIALGIVQGLTEFLPVSSSGHLVLAERLFGVDPPGVTFEVMLHAGTLLAVLVYFRKRLVGIVRDLGGGWAGMDGLRGWKYIVWIAIGTIPAVIIGLLLKNHIESAFSDPRAAAGFLIVTGILLFATLPNYGGKRPLGWWRALVVGCAQAAALLPGISRSGSTISTAMILGQGRRRVFFYPFHPGDFRRIRIIFKRGGSRGSIGRDAGGVRCGKYRRRDRWIYFDLAVIWDD